MKLPDRVLKRVLMNGSTVGNKILSQLPLGVQNQLLKPILDAIVLKGFDQDDLAFMTDRVLLIEVVDWQLRHYFTVNNGRVVLVEEREPDVRFCGEFASFLSLVTRSQDPDTLFFQRRLTINGDTELALEIKALFDNVEIDSTAPPIKNTLFWLDKKFNPQVV